MNLVCPVQHKNRIKREVCCIKTLNTIYLYGLNERARKNNKKIPVEKLFFLLELSSSLLDIEATVVIIQSDIKNSFYKKRVILNTLK